MERAASRQSAAGSAANSMSAMMCSATASSSAALFGTWLYSDITPAPSSAASRRIDAAAAPSRSIRLSAVRTMSSRLSGPAICPLPPPCHPLTTYIVRATVVTYVRCTYEVVGRARGMSTKDMYVLPSAESWNVEATGSTRFSWEYDDSREKLLALYQKGKDKQWDAEKRIDWSLEVDPYDALGLPDGTIAIYGSRWWNAMS